MKKYFTGSTLKIIAVISMILDHFSQIILKQGIILNAPYAMFTDTQFSVLLTVSDIFHILGRIAFPIFLFFTSRRFFTYTELEKIFFEFRSFRRSFRACL